MDSNVRTDGRLKYIITVTKSIHEALHRSRKLLTVKVAVHTPWAPHGSRVMRARGRLVSRHHPIRWKPARATGCHAIGRVRPP